MWHVSISLQANGRMLDQPARLERKAIAALRGVGSEREWWTVGESGIGHLRVGLTEAEVAQVQPDMVVADAGDAGPERPRSR